MFSQFRPEENNLGRFNANSEKGAGRDVPVPAAEINGWCRRPA